MNASFAQMVSPTGCFVSGSNSNWIQYANSGYIKTTTNAATQSLARIKARIQKGEPLRKLLIASIETHIAHHGCAGELSGMRTLSRSGRIRAVYTAYAKSMNEGV